MSSKWKSLQEAYVKGSVDLDALLVEAGVEGQLAEVQQFLLKHPPSFGSLLRSCFVPYDWTLRASLIESMDSIRFYTCRCAYDLLAQYKTQRALLLIKNVCGEHMWEKWIRDAMMSTLDTHVRNDLAKYLQEAGLLQNEDQQTIQHLVKLQEMYPVESYDGSLDQCTNLLTRRGVGRLMTNSSSQIEAMLSGFCKNSLKEELNGLSVHLGTNNIWEKTMDLAFQENTKSSSSSSFHGEITSSPLYIKAAAHWFQDISEDTFYRMLFEAEVLLSRLKGTQIISPYLEYSGQRWKTQMQYYVAHGMVEEAINQLDDIPESCKFKTLLKVAWNQKRGEQGRSGEKSKYFQTEVEVLDCVNPDDCCIHYHGRRLFEQRMLSNGLWLQTEWDSVEQWFSFLSRTGLLFNSSTASLSSFPDGVRSLVQNEQVVALMVDYCIRNDLPTALYNFLECNKIRSDLRMMHYLEPRMKYCAWAQWLVLSRNQEFSFQATLANAKYLVQKTQKVEIHSFQDLVQHGSIYATLATLIQSPLPLSQALTLQKTRKKGTRLEAADLGSMAKGPICFLSDLEARLKDTFPETLEALRSIAKKGSHQGKLTQHQFAEWKSGMLRKELGNLAFMDMLIQCDVPELSKLLEWNLDCTSEEMLDPSFNSGRLETAEFWENQYLSKISHWLDSLSQEEHLSGIFVGVAYYLSMGRPVAALRWFLANKDLTAVLSTAEFGQLLNAQDIQVLEKLTRVLAILYFRDSLIVSSCLTFAAGCGLNASRIKIDTCTLQKIESIAQHSKTGIDVTALANGLAQEIQTGQSGNFAFGKVQTQNYPHPVSTDILAHLESLALQETQSIRAFSADSTRDSSPLGLEESVEVILIWSLAHAFAEVHHLKQSHRILEKLAQSNDWILFLAGVTALQPPLHEIIEIVDTHFTDEKLKHHMKLILEHQTDHKAGNASQKMPGLSSDLFSSTFPESPVSMELFDILTEAERTRNPAGVLLHWAWNLKWKFLVIISACYTPSSYLQCLVVWLQITEAKPNSAQKGKGILAQLMRYITGACQKQNFDLLLDGFQLFPVIASIEIIDSFFQGLKNHTLHFYQAAISHFTIFSELLEAKKKQELENYDFLLLAKITEAAVFSVLQSLSSFYEQKNLLDCLLQIQSLSKIGFRWLEVLKVMKLAYELLGELTEEYISWSVIDVEESYVYYPHFSVVEILEKLQREGKWLEAREWANINTLSVLEITTRQAIVMIREWLALELPTEFLWNEINQLFLDYEYPPLKAGLFYIQQAAKHDSCRHHLTKEMFMEALKWLEGQIQDYDDQPTGLIDRLRNILYLMNSTENVLKMDLTQNHTFSKTKDRNPIIEMILKPSLQDDGVVSVDAIQMSKSGGPSLSSSVGTDVHQSFKMSQNEISISLEVQEGLELLQEMTPCVSETQIETTIRMLLEYGQLEVAKKFANSKKYLNQINIRLIDISLAVIKKCPSNIWEFGESSFESIISPKIIHMFISGGHLGELDHPTPQEMLDIIVLACKKYGSGQICARSAALFRASCFLNMTCLELASYGLSSALDYILHSGTDAYPIAKEFAAAFQILPRIVATKLAHGYLNSLMLTPANSTISENVRAGRRRSRKEECTSSPPMGHVLISDAEICLDWVEIGNALMQLLVERHGNLPSLVEAEILVQSYKCYKRVQYVEGLDVVLELATSRVQQFCADQKFEALVKLIVGICHFDGIFEAIDTIIKNKELELLLEDNNSHDPSIFSTLKCSILNSISRQCPDDVDMLSLTHRHFNMHAEYGHGLKSKATELLERHILAGRPVRDPGLLEALNVLIHAGAAYSCAQCSISAAECGSLVALVAQQICFDDRQWVCLSETECKEVLPELSDIGSALLVARAYNFNSAQDWAVTLWQHILHMARFFYGKRPSTGVLTRATESMLVYCQGVMKEVVFTETHLDQVVQMYLAFPASNSSSSKVSVNHAVLARCLVKFLESIIDIQQRLKLCEMLKTEQRVSSLIEYKSILEKAADEFYCISPL